MNEAKAALKRAHADLADATRDHAEIQSKSAHSRLERSINHFAPLIVEAMESSRREK